MAIPHHTVGRSWKVENQDAPENYDCNLYHYCSIYINIEISDHLLAAHGRARYGISATIRSIQDSNRFVDMNNSSNMSKKPKDFAASGRHGRCS